jgi:hypothetical protein
VTPDNMRSAVLRLLDDPGLASAAASVPAEIETMPSADEVPRLVDLPYIEATGTGPWQATMSRVSGFL